MSRSCAQNLVVCSMENAKESSRKTIHDVARVAGVSIKTVSHVLNGKPGVSKETRARVLSASKQLGYHPHSGARSLRDTAIRSIGVTFPAPLSVVPLSRSFLVWMFEELLRVFGPRGYYVTFDMEPFAHPESGDYARGVWEQTFGACLLAGPLAVNDQVARRLHEAGVPYVALGRIESFPECSYATVDYEDATYIAVKHLIARGHHRIGMVKAFSGFQAGIERRRGYERALHEAGIPYDGDLVKSVTFGEHNIASMVHRILAQPKVTALLDCSGTENASALCDGARRAGRTPGDDLDVVVWTYTNEAAVLPEACAHVWLPVRESAAEGLEELSRWVERDRNEPIHILYRPTLYESLPLASVPVSKRLFETGD